MRQPDEQPAPPNPEPARPADSPWDPLVLVVCVTLPVCLALAHAANGADAAHDEAMVRGVGLGWTGAFRALDAVWAGLVQWLPLGTRASRAAVGSAMASGASGGIVFLLARALARARAPESKLVSFVAAVASLSATLSPPWVTEAMAPAGSTLGGALGFAPLAIVAAGGGALESRLVVSALGMGMAVSYEPLAGFAAVSSVCVWWGTRPKEERAIDRSSQVRAAVAFVVGCVPFALAFARRGSELATNVAALAQATGERAQSVPGIPLMFAREDVGLVSCAAMVAGLVIACLVPRARPLAMSVASIALVGIVSMSLGAAAGPTRYAAPVLAAVGAAQALAAVALQSIVQVVAEARVPFAQASGAMILVLEMALPARAADDASARADERSGRATPIWDDAALSDLPSGAALLVSSPRVETRLLAARAAGEMRADIALVPLFDLAGHVAMRELARDVKLEPLWHDAALVGPPQEWSLSSLAAWRPLVAPYDPTWDRALARHFVPIALFARFEPEPRGASDRRRALDDFAPLRDELARALETDPELLSLTASLLRARAITLAATSERDVVNHALDDLRPFSPGDPVALEIAHRLTASRGAIDVTDLK